MAGRLKLAGGCAALALGVALCAPSGSTADQRPSLARAATAGAHCTLTAAAPTEAGDRITGTGSIRCRTSRRLHMHIETQVLQQGQWGAFGSLDGYVHVRAGRTRHVSTGPANCRGLGQVQMRTVLRLVQFPRTLSQTTSRTVQIACSGRNGMPGPTASCQPNPQSPTSDNGRMSASGTVSCSSRATLNLDLQLQVYYNGSWQQVSDTGRSGFNAAANTTYTFTTTPTPCGPPPSPGSPPPPPEQWRSFMMVDGGTGPITKVSPVVVLTTC